MTREIRPLHGGSQAHLVEADDGFCYVVKFQGNPQGTPTLANEFVAGSLMRELGVSAPPLALVWASEAFLRSNPGLFFRFPHRFKPIEPGVHLGSKFPGHPAETAVYDSFPTKFLPKLGNVQDFLGALVLDKWLSNTDHRQTVYFKSRRARKQTDHLAVSSNANYVAMMIDHGLAFGGSDWRFTDAPLHGLHRDAAVYASIKSLREFAPWFQRMDLITDELLQRIYSQIPREWFENNGGRFCDLFEALRRRKSNVPRLVEEAMCLRVALAEYPRAAMARATVNTVNSVVLPNYSLKP